jgi:hypothetical protein
MENNIIEYKKNLKEKIKNSILTKKNYNIVLNDTTNHLKIKDKVICFYNGKIWNIILLNDMLCYPVLYFDAFSSKDDSKYINSLVVCPISLRSIIYKGKIKIIDIIKNNLITYQLIIWH